MVLIIVSILLVLGIAYFQSTQGLFNALIMAILSALCAAIAMGWYEPMAVALLYDKHMAYAEALCLVALFVVPLVVLRVLFDALIRGNVVFHAWVDRIGGGAAGLIVGMICVGIFMLAAQMLPWGPSLLGYKPFKEDLSRNQRLHPFCPDEFVVGFGEAVSRGALSGSVDFRRSHDNLLRELYCARYRLKKTGEVRVGRRTKKTVTDRMGRVDAGPDDLVVGAAVECPADFARQWSPGKMHPLLGAAANRSDRIVLIRTKVSADAIEGRDGGAAANWWILPAVHFRLVTTDETGNTRSRYPLGYLTRLAPGGADAKSEAERAKRETPHEWIFIGPRRDGAGGIWLRASVAVERRWSGGSKDLIVDWVFVLPPDRLPSTKTPAYMVFRRAARADVPPVVADGKGEKNATRLLNSLDFKSAVLHRTLRW